MISSVYLILLGKVCSCLYIAYIHFHIIYIYIGRDQSTQSHIAIDVSIPQPYFLVSDNEINANIAKMENFEII